MKQQQQEIANRRENEKKKKIESWWEKNCCITLFHPTENWCVNFSSSKIWTQSLWKPKTENKNPNQDQIVNV